MKCFKLSLFVLLVCILFASLCFSETEPESFKLVDEDFSKAVLPLSFVKGLPTVEVKIQAKSYRLILDTGYDRATIRLRPHVLEKTLSTTWIAAITPWISMEEHIATGIL